MRKGHTCRNPTTTILLKLELYVGWFQRRGFVPRKQLPQENKCPWLNEDYRPAFCCCCSCNFFYWSVVDLQYCVSCRCTAKFQLFFQLIFHYRFLQDNLVSCAVGPCLSSVLNFFFILEYSRSTMLLVSGVQQSDSVIHISIPFQILFPYRLLQNIE